MTIAYEAVQYNRGFTEEGSSPTGFAETHYDKVPSPLDQENIGSLLISNAVGGILGALNSIPDFTIGNYQRRSAFQQARFYQNQKDQNYQNVSTLGVSTGSNAVSLGNINFPVTNSSSNTTEATPKSF